MRRLAWTLPGLLVIARLAAAQANDCPKDTLRIAANAPLTVPGTANLVVILASEDKPLRELQTTPSNGEWKPADGDINALLEAKAVDPRAVIAFEKRVTSGNQVLCEHAAWEATRNPSAPILSPAAQNPLTASPLEDRAFKGSECRLAGALWETQLRAQLPSSRFTEIVFPDGTPSESATPCYYNRDYGVVGDPVYVAVFTENPLAWTDLAFDPCSVESAAPNVLQASEKFPTALTSIQQAAGEYHIATFLPRRCYNTSVDVTVRGTIANQVRTRRYPLKQSDRYRATLQAGVLFTTQHDHDFGLRPSPSNTTQQVIFDKGPTERGPEYTASLVLYAFPRYVASLFGSGERSYPGRDVLHDQTMLDRLGLVLGVGLTNPAKRFVVGLSLEVLYGVNAVGVLEFAKVQRLNGFVVGESFTSTGDSIPTTAVWNTDVVFGLSVDVRYVSLLFTGNR